MKKRLFVILLAVTVVAAAFSCRSTTTVRERVKAIPYKRFENYSFDPSLPLIDRVEKVPDIVLSYYRKMDEAPSYAAYAPSREEMREIERCLAALPGVHRRVLEEKLLGIYFIDNFLGSGMADYVLDEDDDMYLILIFNPLTLKAGLSEYVSYKENTCFVQDDPAIEIEIELGDSYSGFMYILMHETTHCIDYIERFTPFVEPHLAELQGRGGHDTSFSGTVWEAYDKVRENVPFAYKDRVTFYGFCGGPKLKLSEAVEVYRGLARTPFVSLYSSFNWAEDFAEYVTYYYFVHGLGLKYRITVRKNGTVLYRYEPLKKEEIRDRSGLIDKKLALSLM